MQHEEFQKFNELSLKILLFGKHSSIVTSVKRIPKFYDGLQPTGRQIKDLLPEIMGTLAAKVGEDPQSILEAWSQIVGPKISKMARAISFDSGVLKVKVENSTLYSLLVEHEKKRLLSELRKRFPKVELRNIHFRVG